MSPAIIAESLLLLLEIFNSSHILLCIDSVASMCPSLWHPLMPVPLLCPQDGLILCSFFQPPAFLIIPCGHILCIMYVAVCCELLWSFMERSTCFSLCDLPDFSVLYSSGQADPISAEHCAETWGPAHFKVLFFYICIKNIGLGPSGNIAYSRFCIIWMKNETE